MKQAAKEAFENNIHYHDTMKTIVRGYLSNRECSVQEAVYHMLPELKLRRIFPPVYLVNTILPEERVQVLFSEKELSKLNELNFYHITYLKINQIRLVNISQMN